MPPDPPNRTFHLWCSHLYFKEFSGKSTFISVMCWLIVWPTVKGRKCFVSSLDLKYIFCHTSPGAFLRRLIHPTPCSVKYSSHCVTIFLGNPIPEITWLKDGKQLLPDGRHLVLSHGRYLLISAVQVADTGRYSCLASNIAGDRSRHFNLNVLGT